MYDDEKNIHTHIYIYIHISYVTPHISIYIYRYTHEGIQGLQQKPAAPSDLRRWLLTDLPGGQRQCWDYLDSRIIGNLNIVDILTCNDMHMKQMFFA